MTQAIQQQSLLTLPAIVVYNALLFRVYNIEVLRFLSTKNHQRKGLIRVSNTIRNPLTLDHTRCQIMIIPPTLSEIE